MYKVQKKRCDYEKGVGTGKERDFMPRMQNRKKKRVVELRTSDIAYKGKSIAKWCMDRGSERHSKKGG